MKKQLRSILLFIAVAFIILTGCSKSDSLVPPAVNNSPGQNTDLTTTNSAQNSSGKTAVTITGIYDFSTLPNTVGTFTTTGALTISGYSTMFVDIVNHPGTQFHCVITLYAPDGTITINQECTFDTPIPKGQWKIVSGTGPYVNLKGNGSLTMPPNTEAMTGVIFNNNN
jgi:hypothetical protein